MDEINQLGKRLKQARIEKGYTLEDVQQLTKIQKRYLISIEENRLEELPSEFFIKTLIRQYSEVLGLNVDHIVAKDSTDSIDRGSQEDLTRTLSRVEMKKESKRKRFAYQVGTRSSLPTFLMVLFIILILGIVWWYFYYMKENPDFISPISNTNQSQVVSSDVSSSSSESSSISDENPSITVEENIDSDFEVNDVNYVIDSLDLPSTLTLETDNSGRSWMNVTMNDEVIFEATLEAGTVQTIDLPADLETLSVRIGYLPSTTIRFGEELLVPKPDNQEEIQTQNFYFKFE